MGDMMGMAHYISRTSSPPLVDLACTVRANTGFPYISVGASPAAIAALHIDFAIVERFTQEVFFQGIDPII